MRVLSARRPRQVPLAVAAALLVALLVCGLVTPARAAPRRAASARPGRVLAEKDVNLDQAAVVARLLRDRGLLVAMTRTSDVFVPLPSRTARANAAGADAFVSVHNNSSPSPAVHGTEVYAQVGNRASVALAERVLAGVTSAAGTRARGVFQRRGDEGDYYFVLRTAAMPAIIVEGGYLSNAAEAQALGTPAFRRRMAEGIAAGVMARFDALPDGGRRPAPPPVSAPGISLPPPSGLTAEVDGRQVRLRWHPVPSATGYRVWRNGEPVGYVGHDPSALVVGGGRDRVVDLVFADSGAPGGNHDYEVRAVVDVAGVVLAESASATTSATRPWLVVVDAGHGGSDPGALGRY